MKKMQGWPGIWEAHISDWCVFTFQWGEPVESELVVLLRRIGKHDIYKNP
jgi:mRNA-degrading endonuclease YafQ of YafQ-DinJ toxin-antitoxin module